MVSPPWRVSRWFPWDPGILVHDRPTIAPRFLHRRRSKAPRTAPRRFVDMIVIRGLGRVFRPVCGLDFKIVRPLGGSVHPNPQPAVRFARFSGGSDRLAVIVSRKPHAKAPRSPTKILKTPCFRRSKAPRGCFRGFGVFAGQGIMPRGDDHHDPHVSDHTSPVNTHPLLFDLSTNGWHASVSAGQTPVTPAYPENSPDGRLAV